MARLLRSWAPLFTAPRTACLDSDGLEGIRYAERELIRYASAMKYLLGVLGVLALAAAAGAGIYLLPIGGPETLREVRAGLATRTIRLESDDSPPATPPAGVLDLVHYPAPLGDNLAYISPEGSTRRPGVVYVAGGFDWGIGSSAWAPAPWDNDQSGGAYRREGITLMYPSLRGSHSNPGENECMLGEVDDIIAAAEYLAGRRDVDPERIYLVGHSTGATLAVLAAELSSRFEAVFAIGPVTSVLDYGDMCVGGVAENIARSPYNFVRELTAPLFLIEGEFESNADSVELYRRLEAPQVSAMVIPTLDHFSVLAPANEIIADFIEAGSPPNVFRTSANSILSVARRGPPLTGALP